MDDIKQQHGNGESSRATWEKYSTDKLLERVGAYIPILQNMESNGTDVQETFDQLLDVLQNGMNVVAQRYTETKGQQQEISTKLLSVLKQFEGLRAVQHKINELHQSNNLKLSKLASTNAALGKDVSAQPVQRMSKSKSVVNRTAVPEKLGANNSMTSDGAKSSPTTVNIPDINKIVALEIKDAQKTTIEINKNTATLEGQSRDLQQAVKAVQKAERAQSVAGTKNEKAKEQVNSALSSLASVNSSTKEDDEIPEYVYPTDIPNIVGSKPKFMNPTTRTFKSGAQKAAQVKNGYVPAHDKFKPYYNLTLKTPKNKRAATHSLGAWASETYHGFANEEDNLAFQRDFLNTFETADLSTQQAMINTILSAVKFTANDKKSGFPTKIAGILLQHPDIRTKLAASQVIPKMAEIVEQGKDVKSTTLGGMFPSQFVKFWQSERDRISSGGKGENAALAMLRDAGYVNNEQGSSNYQQFIQELVSSEVLRGKRINLTNEEREAFLNSLNESSISIPKTFGKVESFIHPGSVYKNQKQGSAAFHNSLNRGQFVGVPVTLDTHLIDPNASDERKHTYETDIPELQSMFGDLSSDSGTFASASALGAFFSPYYGQEPSSKATSYALLGTGFHKLMELMSKSPSNPSPLLPEQIQTAEQILALQNANQSGELSPHDPEGQIFNGNVFSLESRQRALEHKANQEASGVEQTLATEKALGMVKQLEHISASEYDQLPEAQKTDYAKDDAGAYNKNFTLVGTVDRIFKNMTTNKVGIEDYKLHSMNSINPFDEFLQLTAGAVLANSSKNEMPGMDNDVDFGKISHTLRENGDTVTRQYQLGSEQDLSNYLELYSAYSRGEIDKDQFVKYLPPSFKKAYNDQYSRLGIKYYIDKRRTIGSADYAKLPKEEQSKYQVQTDGSYVKPSEQHSYFGVRAGSNKNGKPIYVGTNSLLQNREAERYVKEALQDSQISEDYKQLLIKRLDQASARFVEPISEGQWNKLSDQEKKNYELSSFGEYTKKLTDKELTANKLLNSIRDTDSYSIYKKKQMAYFNRDSESKDSITLQEIKDSARRDKKTENEIAQAMGYPSMKDMQRDYYSREANGGITEKEYNSLPEQLKKEFLQAYMDDDSSRPLPWYGKSLEAGNKPHFITANNYADLSDNQKTAYVAMSSDDSSPFQYRLSSAGLIHPYSIQDDIIANVNNEGGFHNASANLLFDRRKRKFVYTSYDRSQDSEYEPEVWDEPDVGNKREMNSIVSSFKRVFSGDDFLNNAKSYLSLLKTIPGNGTPDNYANLEKAKAALFNGISYRGDEYYTDKRQIDAPSNKQLKQTLIDYVFSQINGLSDKGFSIPETGAIARLFTTYFGQNLEKNPVSHAGRGLARALMAEDVYADPEVGTGEYRNEQKQEIAFSRLLKDQVPSGGTTDDVYNELYKFLYDKVSDLSRSDKESEKAEFIEKYGNAIFGLVKANNIVSASPTLRKDAIGWFNSGVVSEGENHKLNKMSVMNNFEAKDSNGLMGIDLIRGDPQHRLSMKNLFLRRTDGGDSQSHSEWVSVDPVSGMQIPVSTWLAPKKIPKTEVSKTEVPKTEVPKTEVPISADSSADGPAPLEGSDAEESAKSEKKSAKRKVRKKKKSISTAESRIPNASPHFILDEKNLELNVSSVTINTNGVNINNITAGGGQSGSGSRSGSGSSAAVKWKLGDKTPKEFKAYESLLKEQYTNEIALFKNKIQYNTTMDPNYKQSLDAYREDLTKQSDDISSALEDEAARLQNSEGFQEWQSIKLGEASDKLQRGKSAAVVSAKGQTTLWGQLSASFAGMVQRFTQFGMAYKLINKVTQGMQSLIKNVKTLDKAVANLRITNGMSDSQAQNMISTYAKLGQQVGATASELSSSAISWLRQGYETNEVLNLVTSSLYLSRLGMIDIDTATKNLTSTLKGFKLEASEAMNVVDKLTAIDVKAATSAGEIANALSNFANIASLNGVSLDQAAAYATTIMDVSQVSGEQAGNSLKMIMSRYANVKSGAFASLDEDSGSEDASLNDVEKVLNKIGISVRSTTMEFRDFDEVLDELADKWDTLDSVTQSAVSSAFAGTRQRESFVTLMNNYDKYSEFLDISENSKGTASKKYESYMESYEAAANKLQASWESLANNSNIRSFMTQMTNMLNFLVKHLPTIVKYALRLFTAMNAFKIPTIGTYIGKYLGIGSGSVNAKTKLVNDEGIGEMWTRQSGHNPFRPYYDKDGNKVGNFFTGRQHNSRLYQEAYIKSNLNQNDNLNLNSAVTAIKGTTDAVSTVGGTVQSIASKMGAENNVGQTPPPSQTLDSIVPGTAEADQDKAAQDEAAVQAEEQVRQQKRMTVASKAATGAITALVAGLTANSVSKDIWNEGVKTENSYEMSAGTSYMAKANTALAAGLGSIGGPGMSTAMSGVADIVNTYVIGPLFDAAQIAVQRVTAEGQKLQTVLGSIDEQISSMSELTKKDIWSAEDYKTYQNNVSDILSTMYKSDNKNSRTIYTRYLREALGGTDSFKNLADINEKSLYELMTIATTTQEQKDLTQAMLIAEAKSDVVATRNSQAEERANLEKENYEALSNASNSIRKENKATAAAAATTAGLGVAGAATLLGSVVQPGIGTVIGAGAGLIAGGFTAAATYNDTLESLEKQYSLTNYSSLSLSEQIDNLQDQLDVAYANNNGDNDKIISALESSITTLKDINSSVLALNQELDEKTIETAITEAQSTNGDYLTNLTSAELKVLGPDTIKALVAEQIQEDGGLEAKKIYANGESGQLTNYADSLISAKIKENDTLSSVFTGQAYTLAEAMKLVTNQTKDSQDTTDYSINSGIVENFMNALHVTSRSALTDSLKTFGNLTLSDLISSTSAIAEKLSSIQTTISDITDLSKTWSEIQNDITDSFPELISSMSNANDLYSALLDKMESYAQLDISAKMTDLMNNTAYYTGTLQPKFEAEIGETYYKKIQGLGITSLNELMKWLENDQDSEYADIQAKISEIVEQELSGIQLTSDYSKEILQSVFKYQETVYQRQLDNLNAQKEALSDINSEREYENKLVEAKLRLENAEKDKKRVWREGVGWVYEADQSAVREAQDNLDQVDADKTLSLLETQIIQLEASKQFLSDIQEEESLDNQQALYEQYMAKYGLSADTITSTFAQNETFSSLSQNASDIYDLLKEEFGINKSSALGYLKDTWQTYESANQAYEALKGQEGTSAYDTAASNRNTALLAYQQAYADASDYISTDDYTADEGYLSLDALNAVKDSAVNEDTNLGSKTYSVKGDSRNPYLSYKSDHQNDDIEYNTTTSTGGEQQKILDAMAKRNGSVVYWAENDDGTFTTATTISKSVMGDYAADVSSMPNGIYRDPVTHTSYYVKNGTVYKLGYSVLDDPSQYVTQATINSIRAQDSFVDDFYTQHPEFIPTEAQGKSSREEQIRLRALMDWEFQNGPLGDDLNMIVSKYPELRPFSSDKISFASLYGKYAEGSLGVLQSTSLINELGTEAIITPQGTITALPSKTGIVPADITANLWQLGKLAPSILKSLGGYSALASTVSNNSNATDESFKIGTINMEVNADNTFDADAFVNSIKTKVALTRNIKG